MADWSQLPKELLDVIAAHTGSSIDTIRLRSVCSAWRAAAALPPASNQHLSLRSLSVEGFAFFDGFFLSKRTIFLLSHPSNSIHDSDSNSESGSWLIKAEQLDQSGLCRLFNPLSGAKLKPSSSDLPYKIDLLNVRVRKLGEEYVLHYHPDTLGGVHGNLYREKVFYLQENDRHHLLLTVHISGKLAMYSSREGKWAVIDDQDVLYDDVIVFDGMFYAVDNNGRTVIIERLDSSNVLTVVAQPVFEGDKKYLVSLGKDLMLVDRYMSGTTETGGEGAVEVADGDDQSLMGDDTHLFKVYKLDKKECNWVEVQSLGDHVLFLGDNCAFAASASDLFWSKGNCICFYFSESHPRDTIEEENASGCLDKIRLFSLEDEKTELLNNVPAYYKLFWPPPRWIGSAS